MFSATKFRTTSSECSKKYKITQRSGVNASRLFEANSAASSRRSEDGRIELSIYQALAIDTKRMNQYTTFTQEEAQEQDSPFDNTPLVSSRADYGHQSLKPCPHQARR